MTDIKLTPKQEKFCQAYVETGNASEAYRRSYNVSKMKAATVNRAAKELMDNPKITARVSILLEGMKERHEVTTDSISMELELARKRSMVFGDHSAAVSASMGKAKLHGLVVDRQHHSGPNGGPIEIKDKTPAAVKTAMDALFKRHATS